jgi:hypothetical protein
MIIRFFATRFAQQPCSRLATPTLTRLADRDPARKSASDRNVQPLLRFNDGLRCHHRGGGSSIPLEPDSDRSWPRDKSVRQSLSRLRSREIATRGGMHVHGSRRNFCEAGPSKPFSRFLLFTRRPENQGSRRQRIANNRLPTRHELQPVAAGSVPKRPKRHTRRTYRR